MRIMSALRALTGMAVVAGLLTVAGCGGPTQEELMVESDSMLATVQETAGRAAALARERNPDVLLELDYDPDRDDWWADCSSLPAPDSKNPTRIVWLAERRFNVELDRETATMIDPIVAALAQDGWVAGTEASGNGDRTVDLAKDGYAVSISGLIDPIPGRAPYLIISVSSPCIEAPEGIADREP
jgi:hypothetical protein